MAGEITQPSQQRFTLHTRAREGSRSIFLLRTRAGYRGPADTGKHPRLGPPGASTFPRIWNRSIDPCEEGVKRKTRHVVDFLAPCLFVVVVLHWQLFCFVSPAAKIASHFFQHFFFNKRKKYRRLAKDSAICRKEARRIVRKENLRARPKVCGTLPLENPARFKRPAMFRVSVAMHQTPWCHLCAFLKGYATNRANKARLH